VVARYVRVLAESESSLSVGLLGEVRQLEDRLGLTPMAMLRMRWEIAPDEVAEKRAESSTVPAVRKRLKVADASST
jgi:hypothetical protein